MNDTGVALSVPQNRPLLRLSHCMPGGWPVAVVVEVCDRCGEDVVLEIDGAGAAEGSITCACGTAVCLL